jgi:hypothetical protein
MTTPPVELPRVAQVALDLAEWKAMWALASVGMWVAQSRHVPRELLELGERYLAELGPDRWNELQHRGERLGRATWPQLHPLTGVDYHAPAEGEGA